MRIDKRPFALLLITCAIHACAQHTAHSTQHTAHNTTAHPNAALKRSRHTKHNTLHNHAPESSIETESARILRTSMPFYGSKGLGSLKRKFDVRSVSLTEEVRSHVRAHTRTRTRTHSLTILDLVPF